MKINQPWRLAAAFALACFFAVTAADAQVGTNNEVVLSVNVTTGATTIINESDSAINIDSYLVLSGLGTPTAGLLNTGGWSSLAPANSWQEFANTNSQRVGEGNPLSNLNLPAGGSQSLGSALTTDFNTIKGIQDAQGGLGNGYLDLDFFFTDDTLGQEFEGLVRYEDILLNNLVLEVNTGTGAASLVNESTSDVKIDFLSISSEAGSLIPTGFDGLGDTRSGWSFASSQNTTNGLVEFFPGDGTPESGDTLVARSAATPLGAIFDSAMDEDLELRVHIVGGSPDGYVGTVRYIDAGLPGDFNGNGTVDAADYTVWRDNLGGDESVLMGNGNGMNGVDPADYDLWKSNFGTTSNAVVSASAVPEPSSLLLLVLGFVAIGFKRR